MADATSGAEPPSPEPGGPTPTDELFAEALGITPASSTRRRRGRTPASQNPAPGARMPPQIPPSQGQIAPPHAAPGQTPPSPAAAGQPAMAPPPSVPSEEAPAVRWAWLSQRRARVRRTHRILRHIDPWSVFKVSVLLYACLYVAVLAAGVLLWNAAQRSGLVDKVESFITEVGSYESWTIDGMVIFGRARIVGLIVATVGVAFNVVMAIMFNLISDLTGGVRLTVLEDERRPPAR
ncbi:DUF3566 domain-containing protein [Candidatus Poriferisodalis sp.]|uniref:DUF3566 domain-containing protein n=1 Tax=Candidatus Poriferisodalis sp. TaxID=3101277 RepID=UPI003B013508